MEALFDALDEAQQGGWAEDSDGLRNTLPTAIRAGDAIMIKGSLGSRMGPLVNAIKDRFPPVRSADQNGRGIGRKGRECSICLAFWVTRRRFSTYSATSHSAPEARS